MRKAVIMKIPIKFGRLYGSRKSFAKLPTLLVIILFLVPTIGCFDVFVSLGCGLDQPKGTDNSNDSYLQPSAKMVKGYGAWVYGEDPSYINLISSYNKIASVDKQIKYVFCWTGELDLGNQQVSAYYEPITSYYKNNLPNCEIHALLDSVDSGDIGRLTPEEINELAQNIADKVNGDPNADGVHLDIEPYNDKIINLCDKLRGITSKPITLSIDEPNPRQEIFKAASIVVLMNYDISDTKSYTMSSFENESMNRAVEFLRAAKDARGYGMIGIPTIATISEYEYRIHKIKGNNESSGYRINENYLKPSLRAAEHAVENVGGENYVGLSLWAFIDEPILANDSCEYDYCMWKYYPYTISKDELTEIASSESRADQRYNTQNPAQKLLDHIGSIFGQ